MSYSRSIKLFFICINFVACSQIDKDVKPIQKSIDDYIASFEKHDLFSGSILIMKGDSILVKQSYGYANYEHKVKNSSNTKYRIASISKIFTKLALIQLMENKLLNFNDNLNRFIPDYPSGDKITIQHLINHSSGIPHLNDFDNYDQIAKEHYTTSEIINLFKNKPLEFSPGEKVTYSNSGYVILVDIIEKVSGLKYGEYLDKYIFKPAGMQNSGHESGAEIVDNLANGYMMNLAGKGLQKPLYYDVSIKIGGGSIYATTKDLLLFSKAYKNGTLSRTTKPLYNQGRLGKSPGFNASIWNYEDFFIVILSNNYSTPLRKISQDVLNITLGRAYKIPEINESLSNNTNDFKNYGGNYKFGDDIITIEKVNDVLIEYENGDKWRGCRLIPIGKDTFFDTYYFEKLVFRRDDITKKITAFTWENGDKAIRIN